MRSRSLHPLLLLCGVLAACASGPSRIAPQEFRATLERLEATHQAGRTGSITGNLYLLHPGLPTVLRNRPVTLLPLSPALEAAVADLQQRFSRDRTPLSPADLERAMRLLREAREAVSALGHGELVYTATTDQQEATFTFAAVPDGRWLLVAALDTPLSILLWASPVTVQAGQSIQHRLNDENIWLEGLTADAMTPETLPTPR